MNRLNANLHYTHIKPINLQEDVIVYVNAMLPEKLPNFPHSNWDVLDLDVLLSDGSFLQRDDVWSLYQKQQLIHSIINQCYIPPVIVVNYWHRIGEAKVTGKVVDGKQRLLAIKGFVTNQFPITLNNQEVYFNDFTDDEKYTFLVHRTLACINYNSHRDIINSDAFLILMYNNLNYKGVAH